MSDGEIRAAALDFLLMQKPRGRFALLSLDYTSLVTGEPVVCGDISEVADGENGVIGASLRAGELDFAYVDRDGARRLDPEAVFTVLHEYGHIMLRHAETGADRAAAEREADIFAYEFLVPEFFVAYTVRQRADVTEKYLAGFLPAPLRLIRKRLRQTRRTRGYMPDGTELELLKRFFGPE